MRVASASRQTRDRTGDGSVLSGDKGYLQSLYIETALAREMSEVLGAVPASPSSALMRRPPPQVAAAR